MTSNLKLTSVKPGSLAVAASCPDRILASRPVAFEGTRLSGSGATGFGGSVVRESVMGLSAMRERNERPIQAPAVAVAQAAHAYVAANGAGAQATWAGDALITGDADTTRKQQTTRAFRGLEPWRDPA